MLIITDIYREYKIFAGLQKHMLSVAAVAKIICEYSKIDLETEHIISACLLHDMGNIIKSDLPRFPELLEPEGLEYWQSVQNEFFLKYGHDEHRATMIVAGEIGVSSRTLEAIKHIGFSYIGAVYDIADIFLKICSYCDMRVGPQGIFSLDERLDDLQVRYSKRGKYDTAIFPKYHMYLHNFETEIFSTTDITPEFITDERIAPVIEELKNWHVV